jgi:hypothetical protein
MKHILHGFCVLFVFAVILSGCGTVGSAWVEPMSPRSDTQRPAPSQRAPQSLQPIRANNEVVKLGPGTFRDPLRITGNNVTVIGAGAGRTIITGGAIIEGNNNVLRNLTIDGQLKIEGNNNDFQAADVRSPVAQINGNNNRF